jgi:hypothetical protein
LRFGVCKTEITKGAEESIFDFGFWIDGLRIGPIALPLALTANPNSQFQNPKSTATASFSTKA